MPMFSAPPDPFTLRVRAYPGGHSKWSLDPGAPPELDVRDAPESPPDPPNLFDLYGRGCEVCDIPPPSSFAPAWPLGNPPAEVGLARDLNGILPFLADRAGAEGWRVASPRSGPHLIIPVRGADAQILALRGLPLSPRPLKDSGYEAEWSPIDSSRPSVLTAPDGFPADDLPTPYVAGTFNDDLVWVARDPVDALLLCALGLTAVSLDAPSATLGSPESVVWLEHLALLRRRRPRGTIVVVDPVTAEPGIAAWGGVLRGLFREVIVSPFMTGNTLAWAVQGYLQGHPLPESLETYLVRCARERGWTCMDRPVALPAKQAGIGTYSEAPVSLGPIGSFTAEELTTPDDDDDVLWIAEPFLASGGFTDVQGIPFAGKTTFLLSLASAVTQGGTFLGYSCEQSPVVYVSEQVRGMMADAVQREPGSLEGVRFVTYDKHGGRPFPEIVAAVHGMCRESGARVVVIDTFFEVAGLEGGESKNDGDIRRLYRVLRPLTLDGICVVTVRHGSEGPGSLQKTGSGSVAVSAGADVSFRFREPTWGAGRRSVEVESRPKGKLRMTVELTSAGWTRVEDRNERPSPAAGQSTADFDDAVLAALDGVEPPGLKSLEVVEKLAGPDGTGPKRPKVDQALKRLMAAKKVVRGRATTREAYLYRLAP